MTIDQSIIDEWVTIHICMILYYCTMIIPTWMIIHSSMIVDCEWNEWRCEMNIWLYYMWILTNVNTERNKIMNIIGHSKG